MTWVEVVTNTRHEVVWLRPSQSEEAARGWRDQHFKQRLFRDDEQHPDGFDMVEGHRWLVRRSRELEAQQLPEWKMETVLVNAVPTVFECVEVGQRWADIGVIEDVAVEIVAQGCRASSTACPKAREDTKQRYSMRTSGHTRLVQEHVIGSST